MLTGTDENGVRLGEADVVALAREQGLELLTVQEVADRLRIGRSTVYLLCKRRVLPTITINRSVRIPAAGLRRWLELRTCQGELEETA